jgi:hypothetical protein
MSELALPHRREGSLLLAMLVMALLSLLLVGAIIGALL